MSSEWPTVTLQEITSVLGDGLHGTPKYDDRGEYCFINGNNLSNGKIVITDKTKRASATEYERHKKDLNDRTVLVSINGTLGNIALYNDEQVFLGKSACYFNVKRGVERLYIRYVLENRDFQDYIHNLATGSTIKNASLKLMREFAFKLPPLNLQKTISGILGALDDKIQINHAINQSLEQIAQTIFKSWFVDFDPVKAKIAAKERWLAMQPMAESASSVCYADEAEALPDLETYMSLAAIGAISGKDEEALASLQHEQPEQYAELWETAELFPSAMQDSELGEIPEGWNAGTLSDACEFQNGHAFKSKDWVESGHPVVKIGAVKPGFVDLVKASYVDSKTVSGLDRFELKTGDILVGMTGYPGETGLVPRFSGRIFLNQRVGRFLPRRPWLYPFIWSAVRNTKFKEFVEGQAHGSAQANVSGNAILQYPLLLAGTATMERFATVVGAQIAEIVSLKAECGHLAQLRDLLLPRLLSGELITPDADQSAAEIVEAAHV